MQEQVPGNVAAPAHSENQGPTPTPGPGEGAEENDARDFDDKPRGTGGPSEGEDDVYQRGDEKSDCVNTSRADGTPSMRDTEEDQGENSTGGQRERRVQAPLSWSSSR